MSADVKERLLDERLRSAAEMAGTFDTFADIGADHGRLSAALLQENAQRRAIVSDISPLALQKAEKLLAACHVADRARFCVSDGLNALRDAEPQPEAVFILGMGGETIGGILQAGCALLNGARLVLGAHTEVPLVRKALCAIGYRISEERYVRAAGRGYTLIAAVPGEGEAECYSERELFLGPCLMTEKPPLWMERVRHRRMLLIKETEAMAHNGADVLKPDVYREKRQQIEWMTELLGGKP